MSRTTLRTTAAALAAAAWLATSAPAQAGRAADALVGTAAALSNLVYGPLKVTYALVGGLVGGGLAYALSAGDTEVASRILDAALRGDYAITADHLRRREDLVFIGFSEEQEDARRKAEPEGRQMPPEEEW